MGVFWRRRRTQTNEAAQVQHSSIEVVDIKRAEHETAEDAKKNIKQLNDLLQRNGITLKIVIATQPGKQH